MGNTNADGMNVWLAEWYEKHEEDAIKLMRDIWEHPELALDTPYGAKAAAEFLKANGFTDVKMHCVEDFHNPEARPNSVIATYGSGKPVIAIVGELDALPELGQESVPWRAPLEGAGHGCGHCLMAGGAAAAGAALRYVMEKEQLPGTLKVIEAPAEESSENGNGKAWLAKEGVFDDLDLALMWHAGLGDLDFNPWIGLAVYDVTYTFTGKAAHAAGMPWEGRSALDAVQLMNMGCEFLREHLPHGSYIHYYIAEGGVAANIVPERAVVHYMFRSANGAGAVKEIFDRATAVAKGASIMTDTGFTYKINSFLPDLTYNVPLCKYMWDVAQKMPMLQYTEEEEQFARKIYEAHFGKKAPEKLSDIIGTGIAPFEPRPDGKHFSTTDVAFMSYLCPTIHITGLMMLMGGPGHHWTTTSMAGYSLGQRSGLFGYRILAQGAYELFKNPEKLKEFREYHKSLNLSELDYSALKAGEK